MNLLNYEIGQQEATKQKVDFVADLEQQMQSQKDQQEGAMVQALVADLESQLHQLDSQVDVLNTAEESQVRI